MNLHRIAIVAVLISFVLFVPVSGFAGPLDRGPMQQRYNPAAEDMLRVPGVVGMYEQDAMSILQQSGLAPELKYSKEFQEDFAGKEGTVIKQDPDTAGVAMLGSIVTITVYWPPSAGEQPGNEESASQAGTSPPPSNQEPVPQWGGGSKPSSDSGWVPPVSPVVQPSDQQEVPIVQAQGEPASPVIIGTQVQQTVTPVSIMPSGGNSNEQNAAAPREDGSCRSWYAIAVDITAEAQRIAKELGCAAVQPPAVWKACLKHIDKVGQWNVYNLKLKERWNRLVKTTSWAAIGPRDLTFGKTHDGRIIGTTGRTFITPIPIFDESIKIKLNKKAGKSRTSVTVCSYMPGGDRINEWHFESPKGNQNNGQTWEMNLSDMDGKLLSIHLDGKSTADTFKYSIFLKGN